MNRLSIVAGLLCTLAATLAAAAPGAPACRATSGGTRAALVELYTSEGCSSCPPAEATLARLGQVLDPGAQVVPLALHVDYWDNLGWKDPYAQPAFATRHSRLVAVNHHDIVYTPHFFVEGRELRSGGDALRAAVRQVNATAAPASLQASAQAGKNGLEIDLAARADPAVDAALYIAVAESGLSSQVTRGENRGSRLAHDHVVRTWIGPLPLTAGSLAVHRTLPAAGTRAELVAFLEDPRTGEVLQAVATGECLAGAADARN